MVTIERKNTEISNRGRTPRNLPARFSRSVTYPLFSLIRLLHVPPMKPVVFLACISLTSPREDDPLLTALIRPNEPYIFFLSRAKR